MTDIPLTENLDFPDGFGKQKLQYVSGIRAVEQRLQIRLNTWLGEWILNELEGIDFLRWLNEKAPHKNSGFRDSIRREITTTPGVRRIKNFSLSLDRADTKLKGSGLLIFDSSELEISTQSGLMSLSTESVNAALSSHILVTLIGE